MEELEGRMDEVQKEGEKLRRREQELNATRREVAVEVRNLESQREKTSSEKVQSKKARRIQDRLSRLDEGITAMDVQETELRRHIHQALEQMERQASEKDEASREVTDWKIKAARLENQEREYLESDCRRLEGEGERLTHQLTELEEQLAGLNPVKQITGKKARSWRSALKSCGSEK